MLPLLAGLAGLALLGNPFRKAAKRRNPKKPHAFVAGFTKEDVSSYKWSMLPGGHLLYHVKLKDGRSLNMNEGSWEALQAGGATKRHRRNPPRDPRFAGSFKGDAPAGSYVDGDTAAVEGPRGWESWIFGAEIGPRGYREAWQFAAKHPSERAAVEHAKEMVWGPIKSNPGRGRRRR